MEKSNCLNCNDIIIYKASQKQGKYCSNKCQMEKQYNDLISLWENKNISPSTRVQRKYISAKQNNKCLNCNISTWQNAPLILELDHIDGNASNNNISNLRMLCPNCHSQTPTFKNKNKGNGRKNRK